MYMALAGSLSDTMPTPGATRSGLAARSTAVGPRELNAAMVSSLRSIVSLYYVNASSDRFRPRSPTSESALRTRKKMDLEVACYILGNDVTTLSLAARPAVKN